MTGFVVSQHVPSADTKVIEVATKILEQVKFCALITLDSTGHPQTRTMEPFPPEDNFIIWFGTNSKSRKVGEIKNNPRTTVYYFDAVNNGYVVLTGKAFLINDKREKERRWMEHWEQFYSDRDESYILIKFITEQLEVVSPAHGLIGESITWRAHTSKIPGNE